MFLPLILTAYLSAVTSSPESIYPSVPPQVNVTAAVLLEAFKDPFGSVHVAQGSISERSAQFQADLLDDVIAQLEGSIVLRLGSAPGELPRRPWLLNVFLVDSYKAFLKQYSMLNAHWYDFSGRYLVIFSEELVEKVVRKVFNDLWKLQIVNVVVMGFAEQKVILWTYFAFSGRACRMVHLRTISKIDLDEMYPDKTTSFHGCLFKVAAFETRPYTIMHRSPNKKLKLSGFEGDILDVLEEKFKFRALIYEPPNGEQWGYPSEQNSTGIIRMIYKEEVDFGMSCLGISVARLKIMKAGIAHHTTSVVLAVPKGRPYTPLEKLTRPFSASVWMLTGTILLVAFISIGIIELRSQQSANLHPSKTLNEIDQTDAFYYVAESGERYFEAFPNRLRRVRHLPQEHNNIIRRLDWMEHHPESPDVVMGTLDAMAHHNLLYRRKGLEPVTICGETITTFSMAIYYPKKSMLTKQFNRQLQQIQAAGLINYWIKQYGDYEFIGKSTGSAEPKQLSNEHLMMAYELYGLLVLICGCRLLSCRSSLEAVHPLEEEVCNHRIASIQRNRDQSHVLNVTDPDRRRPSVRHGLFRIVAVPPDTATCVLRNLHELTSLWKDLVVIAQRDRGDQHDS
ncbi:hypothetical protein quinque_014401 [Culex quinquefasciatus]